MKSLFCPSCGKEFIKNTSAQIYCTDKCMRKDTLLLRRVINKKDYPEYYEIKRIKNEIDKVTKEKERIELIAVALCHNIVRNHKCIEMTVRKQYELHGVVL
ncbi:MAG: hypothetical protein WC389_03550 [Lutibacter sp.]|jgi:glutamyl/glutaminyl-tRNA synthetase